MSWFHRKKVYFFLNNFLKRGHILHAGTHMCTHFSYESLHQGWTIHHCSFQFNLLRQRPCLQSHRGSGRLQLAVLCRAGHPGLSDMGWRSCRDHYHASTESVPTNSQCTAVWSPKQIHKQVTLYTSSQTCPNCKTVTHTKGHVGKYWDYTNEPTTNIKLKRRSSHCRPGLDNDTL